MSFDAHKLFIFMKSNFLKKVIAHAFHVKSDSTAKSEVMKIYLMLSSNSFPVLALLFRLLIHLELLFVHGMR